ncbi:MULTISPECIES: hypothetical protein [unclassified Mesorhizobium]|nr:MULTISPECIES: hypothetical protein [unclassified Mesorhizobium]
MMLINPFVFSTPPTPPPALKQAQVTPSVYVNSSGPRQSMLPGIFINEA